MKNEYIKVVKRWIAGEEVSVEALQANADAAKAAYDANTYCWAAYADAAAYAAAAADAAAVAVAVAVDAAEAGESAEAAKWIKRYEDVTHWMHIPKE